MKKPIKKPDMDIQIDFKNDDTIEDPSFINVNNSVVSLLFEICFHLSSVNKLFASTVKESFE